MNLAADMLARLSAGTEQRAITLLSPDGRGLETWSRARLANEIFAWQRRLIVARLAPGERVAVAAERDPSAAALHVALLASGLVVVPINTALTPPEAASVLETADARLVISSATFAARVRATCPANVPWWTSPPAGEVPRHASRETGAQPYLVERKSDDDALVIHTSGTTGRPKSVPISHGNLQHNLDTLAAVWGRRASDRLLHVLPLHHYHGLVLALYGSLAVGCELALLPRFEARTVLDTIRRHGISLLMGVPTMYARLIDAARDEHDVGTLRLAISGSAPLGESLWKRFHERFGIEIVERYGLTETGIVTSNPPAAVRPGSVGFALAGMTIAIHAAETYLTHDPATRRTTPRGEICIAGPTVMRGYGNDPEANARSFRDGYFHSGDLGFFDGDGYLWVDGRIKDLIIVGGSNVVPGEVERVLSVVPEAAELCVTGLADTDLGEIVAAFVVARAGLPACDVEVALRRAAEAGLAPYKRPRRYVFLPELPRNSMGKVDRTRLSASAA